MATPTPRDLHVDSLLTQISIAYANPAFISDQMSPILNVNKQSDLYPTYDMSHWFRDEARIRAPRTRSEGGGWTVGTDSYFCNRFSFRAEISDEERDNADSVWNLEEDATTFAKGMVDMRRERALAARVFTTGVWANDDPAPGDFVVWSDYSNSNPLTDMTKYVDEVESRIGREANTFVIGKAVYNQLRWHPDLLDSIKWTQRGVLTEELIRSLLDVERLLIGRGLVTTSPEGTPEASVVYSRIWGKHGLGMDVTPRPR